MATKLSGFARPMTAKHVPQSGFFFTSVNRLKTIDTPKNLLSEERLERAEDELERRKLAVASHVEQESNYKHWKMTKKYDIDNMSKVRNISSIEALLLNHKYHHHRSLRNMSDQLKNKQMNVRRVGERCFSAKRNLRSDCEIKLGKR